MAQIAYVDWDGLVYYDGKIKQYISDIADGCLKAGGKIPFAQLPRPSHDNLNYVYKITDSFTSTDDFDKPGFKYEAGALVQVETPANSNTYRYTVIYEVIHVDDLEQRVTSLEEGVEEHTVDIGTLSTSIDELYAMLGTEYAKKSDIPSIDGLASEQYVNEAVQDALENIAFDDKQVVENTAAIQSLNESVSSIEDGLQSIENNLDGALGGIEELIDDVSQLSEQIATKADGKHNHTLSDISDYAPVDLSPYAKKDWVEEQQYLTEHQSLEGYAKVSDIPTNVSVFINDAGYAKSSDVNEKLENKAHKSHSHSEYALRTEIPKKVSDLTNDSQFVTEFSLQNKGFLTEHQSLDGYAKSVEIPTKVSQLTNDSGYLTSVPDEYVTAAELAAKRYLSVIPSEYITSDELDARGYLTRHQSLDGYAKLTDIPKIPTQVSAFQNDSKYVTTELLESSIANIVFPTTDLSNYYTKDKVYNKLEVDRELIKKADVDDLPNFSTFATKSEVKKKLDASTYEEDRPHYALKTEIFSGSYDDLTNKPSIPSIDGLASESFVRQQIAAAQFEGGQADVDLIEEYLSDYYKKGETYSRTQIDARIPSLDGYAKQQWVEQQQYLTASSDIIKGKANKSDIISDTIDLTNSAGFITENEALSAVAKVGYITDVSGKLDVETYESDKKSFALKSDIPSVDRFITAKDVPSYIPEEYVTNDEITNLATREELEAVQTVAGQNSVKLFQLDSDLVDINAKLDTIPTKTSDLVNDSNFLTEHQDISGKADKADTLSGYGIIDAYTRTEIDTKLLEIESGGKIDEETLKGFVSEDEWNERIGAYALKTDIPTDYLKEVPDEYITETELNAKGYLTEHQDLSEYALKSDIPTDYLKEIPSEYITETELESKGYLTEHQSLADYAKISDIPDTSAFITMQDVEDKGYLTSHQSLEHLATKDELNILENNIGYVKVDDRSFAEVIDETFAKKSDVEGFATEQFVTDEIGKITIPTKTSELTNDSNFLTQHQDISGKQDVLSFEGEYNANTNKVATKSYVDTALSSINLADVLSTKADNVPFNKPMLVTKPIGNLEQDEDLCGRTIVYILTKMLGLEEQPEHGEVTVEDVKEKSIPVMQGGVNTSDGSTKVEDTNSTFTYLEIAAADSEKAPVAAEPGTSALYEIKNDSGEVIEHGYQIYTIASGRGTYWRVSIPVGLVIKEVQMYDAGQSMWVEYTPEFTDTGERLESNGYDYVVYQSSDRANEEILRFILE